MRVAQTSFLGLVGLVLAFGTQLRAQYSEEVLLDEPVAYWRLGEEDPLLPAENQGTESVLADGIYTGGVILEEDGLLSDDDDTAALFDGLDAEVRVPDNAEINTGGPWQAKTVELWFNAHEIGPEPGMIYQQGGTTRGLNVYVQEVDGDPLLFMSAWNRAEELWEPVWVSTEVEPEVTYHAVMVLDATENDIFGDFDGRITGYLDGEEFDTAIGADQLYAHGNNISIGSVQNNTFYPDGLATNPTNGHFFVGVIDEVSLYNIALDDPDGDKDLSDSRVLDHFEAGSGPKVPCPKRLQAARDGDNVKLTWDVEGMPTSVRVVRDGVELAAAAPVDPPEYVDTTAAPGSLRYELTFDIAECRTLTRRFDGCIVDLQANAALDGNMLTWTNQFAYAGIVILRDDVEIATIGGDLETFTDTDPAIGTQRYSVVPADGDCEPVSAGVTRGEVLGTGTDSLLGDDLTDVGDDGDQLFYFPPDDLGNFDAIFFSSDEPGFEGGEFAYNVFDNILGPGNDKWCCGTVFPQIVGADFTEFDVSYRLTHFTVSSANDVPDRDPRVWSIEGSIDGEEWTTIFSQDDPDAALWTERLQVILFQEGVDYEVQDEAYSMFRMVTEATGLTSGAFFQVGEIEFFGEEGPRVEPGASLKPGDVNGDASFNIADMVAQLGFLFGGVTLPECYTVPGSDPPALNSAGLLMLDYNGDGMANIADAVAGLGGLFGGGGPHVLGEGCTDIDGTCQDNCQ